VVNYQYIKMDQKRRLRI